MGQRGTVLCGIPWGVSCMEYVPTFNQTMAQMYIAIYIYICVYIYLYIYIYIFITWSLWDMKRIEKVYCEENVM